MSFSNLSRKARKKVLLQVKRQRVKNTCTLREDNRPIELGTSLKDLYNEINGGLRSALTYAGAKNINEFHKNARFIEVTSNYMAESKPRSSQ